MKNLPIGYQLVKASQNNVAFLISNRPNMQTEVTKDFLNKLFENFNVSIYVTPAGERAITIKLENDFLIRVTCQQDGIKHFSLFSNNLNEYLTDHAFKCLQTTIVYQGNYIRKYNEKSIKKYLDFFTEVTNNLANVRADLDNLKNDKVIELMKKDFFQVTAAEGFVYICSKPLTTTAHTITANVSYNVSDNTFNYSLHNDVEISNNIDIFKNEAILNRLNENLGLSINDICEAILVPNTYKRSLLNPILDEFKNRNLEFVFKITDFTFTINKDFEMSNHFVSLINDNEIRLLLKSLTEILNK